MESSVIYTKTQSNLNEKKNNKSFKFTHRISRKKRNIKSNKKMAIHIHPIRIWMQSLKLKISISKKMWKNWKEFCCEKFLPIWNELKKMTGNQSRIHFTFFFFYWRRWWWCNEKKNVAENPRKKWWWWSPFSFIRFGNYYYYYIATLITFNDLSWAFFWK